MLVRAEGRAASRSRGNVGIRLLRCLVIVAPAAIGFLIPSPSWASTFLATAGEEQPRSYLHGGGGTATNTATFTRTPVPTAPALTPTFTPTLTGTPPTLTPTVTPTPTSTTIPPCGPAWRLDDNPNPSSRNNFLGAVAAVSANDVWAVGASSGTLVEHWDGTRWSVISSPNPGPSGNTLLGVSASSATDAWAVGYSERLVEQNTLILHWDGDTWTVAESPNVPGGSDHFLFGVAAISPTDAWAVGNYKDSAGVQRMLLLRWDGAEWSIVSGPNVGTISSALNAITALSSTDVWAVGHHPVSGEAQTLILHWDGSDWSVVPSPSLGNSYLTSVAAVSHNDVWAVGNRGGIMRQTLTMHWDGSTWSIVSSPSPGTDDSELAGVAAVGADDVWAVGLTRSNEPLPIDRTLALHWDGTGWSVVGSPNRGSYIDSFIDVAATSDGNLWAVGNYFHGGPYWSLIARYTEPCAGATPTPTQTATPCSMPFTDVSPTDYFYEAVHYLYCAGVVSGYADDTFRPYYYATRGQLCKIIVLAEGWAIDTSGGPHFTDVPPANPYYEYIETAFNRGVVSGYADGAFRWGNQLTRGQLCKIVVSAEGWPIDTSGGPHFTDVPPDHTFYGWIETAYNRGIISGYSCGQGCLEFRSGNSSTRGQICKIMYNAVRPGR